jgi:hypothetical protein
MAQFTFHVREGDAVTRDPQAFDFATAQAARDAAVAVMREMLREHPGEFDDKQIEIADETGHAIAVVDIHEVMPVRRFH